MASAVRKGIILQGTAAPAQWQSAVDLTADQAQGDELDFAEDWPDTVYMYHPLPELYADWQEFVVDSQGSTTEDGKQMKELLLACKEKWNRDLKEVSRTIESDASGLATAWVAYRETAKRDTGAAGKKKPQNAEQFLDSLYFRAWYLRQAVDICDGKRWAPKSSAEHGRSSFRASSGACSLM